jgi:hypothetical protein
MLDELDRELERPGHPFGWGTTIPRGIAVSVIVFILMHIITAG